MAWGSDPGAPYGRNVYGRPYANEVERSADFIKQQSDQTQQWLDEMHEQNQAGARAAREGGLLGAGLGALWWMARNQGQQLNQQPSQDQQPDASDPQAQPQVRTGPSHGRELTLTVAVAVGAVFTGWWWLWVLAVVLVVTVLVTWNRRVPWR